jgi:hypothetical protein
LAVTFTALINSVAAALKPRAQQVGMDVEVALDLESAEAFLNAAPNRPRLILHWEGFGDHALSRQGMTIHQLATVIQMAKGLGHRPGTRLTNPGPYGQVPFSTRIEQVTGWMTGMRFPDGTQADWAGFSLAGSQWITTAVKTQQCHGFNWRLDAALPPPPEEILLQFDNLTSSYPTNL